MRNEELIPVLKKRHLQYEVQMSFFLGSVWET